MGPMGTVVLLSSKLFFPVNGELPSLGHSPLYSLALMYGYERRQCFIHFANH